MLNSRTAIHCTAFFKQNLPSLGLGILEPRPGIVSAIARHGQVISSGPQRPRGLSKGWRL